MFNAKSKKDKSTKNKLNHPLTIGHNTYEMIVFSHLRWNFVYQRPQHIISRFSHKYKILFIEEPIEYKTSEKNTFELEWVSPNLTILRPKVDTIEDISHILSNFDLSHLKVAWFYSAAFVTLLEVVVAKTIVYDCMDELSMFKGADKKLQSQEKSLMLKADLIFTGGKSLYEEKSKFKGNLYCFKSSVDIDHFSKAHKELPIPDDMRCLYKRIVGYIGVIDERIDLELIEKTAKKMEHYDFVMIGPIVKINIETLPQRENIYYLGMKSYDELPQYLSAFEVAMMPFAINDATKFISPTKTLEYMAAGKPIISTPIRDVVRDYKDSTYIISSPDEFCEALDKIQNIKRDYSIYYSSILHRSSWDATANKMEQLIRIHAQ